MAVMTAPCEAVEKSALEQGALWRDHGIDRHRTLVRTIARVETAPIGKDEG